MNSRKKIREFVLLEKSTPRKKVKSELALVKKVCACVCMLKECEYG